MFAKKAIERIGEIASDLFEELSTGLRGNVGDLHAPGFEIDDEEHEVADEAGTCEDFDGEEIGWPRRRPNGTSGTCSKLWCDRARDRCHSL